MIFILIALIVYIYINHAFTILFQHIYTHIIEALFELAGKFIKTKKGSGFKAAPFFLKEDGG